MLQFDPAPFPVAFQEAWVCVHQGAIQQVTRTLHTLHEQDSLAVCKDHREDSMGIFVFSILCSFTLIVTVGVYSLFLASLGKGFIITFKNVVIQVV